MQNQDYIDSAGVCDLLHISPSSLANWRKAGNFPEPLRLTKRKLLFRKVDVVAYIESKSNNNK